MKGWVNNVKKNKFEIDMCNGSIMDKLISFSLPLMVSGILQLAFNAVDIIVVGRFSGSQALAAVGSTTALINVFTNLFIGISLGANVLAARFYAAGKDREMSETVHTSITLALISGIMMAVIGVLLAKWALEIMGTPDDVIGQSALYMRIYFMGMPFFMLYNYGAAILRAIGDTKRPLIFLIISGIANAALNMILVILFHMGVAGVAIGTIISQLISCVLVLTCLYRSEGSYQLRFSKLKINGAYMEQIFQVGVPAGIQSTVINLSNALLQSSVNSFGSIAMAGYTAANNMLGFLYMSVNSITQACMSFTSQNYGVGKLKRMDKVLRDCAILSISIAVVLGGLAYCFGPADSDNLYFRSKGYQLRNGNPGVYIDHLFPVWDHGFVSGCASWNGIFSSPDGAFSDRNGGNKNCVGIWNFSEPQIFIRTFCILSGVMDPYHCTSGRVLLFCEKKGTSERKKIVINRTKL